MALKELCAVNGNLNANEVIHEDEKDGNGSETDESSSHHRFSMNGRMEMKRNALRIGLVLLTALLAYAVPVFGSLASLSGGVGGVSLGFICPALIIRKIPGAWKKLSKFEQKFMWPWVLIFGCIMVVASPVMVILNLVEDN